MTSRWWVPVTRALPKELRLVAEQAGQGKRNVQKTAWLFTELSGGARGIAGGGALLLSIEPANLKAAAEVVVRDGNLEGPGRAYITANESLRCCAAMCALRVTIPEPAAVYRALCAALPVACPEACIELLFSLALAFGKATPATEAEAQNAVWRHNMPRLIAGHLAGQNLQQVGIRRLAAAMHAMVALNISSKPLMRRLVEQLEVQVANFVQSASLDLHAHTWVEAVQSLPNALASVRTLLSTFTHPMCPREDSDGGTSALLLGDIYSSAEAAAGCVSVGELDSSFSMPFDLLFKRSVMHLDTELLLAAEKLAREISRDSHAHGASKETKVAMRAPVFGQFVLAFPEIASNHGLVFEQHLRAHYSVLWERVWPESLVEVLAASVGMWSSAMASVASRRLALACLRLGRSDLFGSIAAQAAHAQLWRLSDVESLHPAWLDLRDRASPASAPPLGTVLHGTRKMDQNRLHCSVRSASIVSAECATSLLCASVDLRLLRGTAALMTEASRLALEPQASPQQLSQLVWCMARLRMRNKDLLSRNVIRRLIPDKLGAETAALMVSCLSLLSVSPTSYHLKNLRTYLLKPGVSQQLPPHILIELLHRIAQERDLGDKVLASLSL